MSLTSSVEDTATSSPSPTLTAIEQKPFIAQKRTGHTSEREVRRGPGVVCDATHGIRITKLGLYVDDREPSLIPLYSFTSPFVPTTTVHGRRRSPKGPGDRRRTGARR